MCENTKRSGTHLLADPVLATNPDYFAAWEHFERTEAVDMGAVYSLKSLLNSSTNKKTRESI